MCETIEKSKQFGRSANGREFVVVNPRFREVGVIHVDGCLINDASRRVDWMVRLPTNKRLRDGTASLKMIELKGSDVLYALTQMAATLLHANVHAEKSLIDEGFVVSQQNPSFFSQFQVAAMNFKTKYGIPVRITSKAVITLD